MKLSKSLRRAAAAILVSSAAMAYAGAALANGTLIVAHESNPDDLQDFNYMVDGQTSGGATLDDDATAPGGDVNLIKTKTFSVIPGDYTISQTHPGPGWVLTGIQCDGPTPAYPNLANRSVSLNVATGAMTTCKFLNERASAPPTGTITIRKQTNPNHPQDFAFYAFGPNSGCCGPFQLDTDPGSALPVSKTFTLAPGSYSFKEDFANPVPVPGWQLSSINCTGGSATVDMNSKSFTANLLAGQNIVCTFVNTPTAPLMAKLTIIKDAVPNDPLDFSFTSSLGAVGSFLLDDDSNATLPNSRTFAVPVGTSFTVTEGTVPGWALVAINCTGSGLLSSTLPGRSAQILFGASPGQGATCIFTNRKETPTTGNVTIIKKLVPAGDPGKFTLQLTPQGGTLLANFLNGGNGATLGPITVPTGNYNVSEVAGNATSLSNYTAVISGAGCGANGAVTLTTGANIVCTITNTRNTAGPLPCLTNAPLSAVVNFFVPGWAVKNICRGGTVTFSKTAGNGFTVTPSVPPGSFTPIPLAAGISSGTTGPFANTGTTPITYKYWSTAGATQGSIIVW